MKRLAVILAAALIVMSVSVTAFAVPDEQSGDEQTTSAAAEENGDENEDQDSAADENTENDNEDSEESSNSETSENTESSEENSRTEQESSSAPTTKIDINNMKFNTYNIKNVDMFIDIPQDMYVLTPNIAEDDPVLDAVKLTKKEVEESFADTDTCIKAFAKDFSFDITVTMTRNSTTKSIGNLTYLDDQKVQQVIDKLLKSDYTKGCAKNTYNNTLFLTLDLEYDSDDTHIYGIQQYTVIKDRNIIVTLQSYDQPISKDQKALLSHIMQSVFFENVEPEESLVSDVGNATFEELDRRYLYIMAASLIAAAALAGMIIAAIKRRETVAKKDEGTTEPETKKPEKKSSLDVKNDDETDDNDIDEDYKNSLLPLADENVLFKNKKSEDKNNASDGETKVFPKIDAGATISIPKNPYTPVGKAEPVTTTEMSVTSEIAKLSIINEEAKRQAELKKQNNEEDDEGVVFAESSPKPKTEIVQIGESVLNKKPMKPSPQDINRAKAVKTPDEDHTQKPLSNFERRFGGGGTSADAKANANANSYNPAKPLATEPLPSVSDKATENTTEFKKPEPQLSSFEKRFGKIQPATSDHPKADKTPVTDEIKPELTEEAPVVEEDAVPEITEETPAVEPEPVPEIAEETPAVEEEAVPEIVEETTAMEEEAVPEIAEETPAVEEEAAPEIAEETPAVEEETVPKITEETPAMEEEAVPEIAEETPIVEEEAAPEIAEETPAVEPEPVPKITEETPAVEEEAAPEIAEETPVVEEEPVPEFVEKTPDVEEEAVPEIVEETAEETPAVPEVTAKIGKTDISDDIDDYLSTVDETDTENAESVGDEDDKTEEPQKLSFFEKFKNKLFDAGEDGLYETELQEPEKNKESTNKFLNTLRDKFKYRVPVPKEELIQKQERKKSESEITKTTESEKTTEGAEIYNAAKIAKATKPQKDAPIELDIQKGENGSIVINDRNGNPLGVEVKDGNAELKVKAEEAAEKAKIEAAKAEKAATEKAKKDAAKAEAERKAREGTEIYRAPEQTAKNTKGKKGRKKKKKEKAANAANPTNLVKEGLNAAVQEKTAETAAAAGTVLTAAEILANAVEAPIKEETPVKPSKKKSRNQKKKINKPQQEIQKEAKPAETKTEAKPEDKKPVEVKAEIKAEDKKPAETKTETKSEVKKPAETKAETKPEVKKPAETKTETKSEDKKTVEAKAETKSEDKKPSETKAETKPEVKKTAETKTETKPKVKKPAETKTETKPEVKKPAETKTETKPEVKKTAETKTETKPEPPKFIFKRDSGIIFEQADDFFSEPIVPKTTIFTHIPRLESVNADDYNKRMDDLLNGNPYPVSSRTDDEPEEENDDPFVLPQPVEPASEPKPIKYESAPVSAKPKQNYKPEVKPEPKPEPDPFAADSEEIPLKDLEQKDSTNLSDMLKKSIGKIFTDADGED